MTQGLVAAYCDDVRIVAPVKDAGDAYNLLKRLASQHLNCVEVPSKGSVIWEGEGTPDLSGLPSDMPGRNDRLLHDKHLGVFVGDSRDHSVAAVKASLLTKFQEKAGLINRLQIRLRLHLSLLSGISTCVCGAPVDPYTISSHEVTCSAIEPPATTSS